MSSVRSHRRLVSLVIGVSTLCVSAVAFAAISSGAFTTASSVQVTTTTLTINKPTVSTDDLMLATIAIHGGSSANISTVPTGWTQIARTDNDASLTLVSYWKIVGGSEPSSYQWIIDGQTTAKGGITAYSGVDGTSPIDASGGNSGLGTTATTSAITTSACNEEVVAIFAVDEGKTNNAGAYFSTPTGMTEKFDVSSTPFGPSMALDEVTQDAGTAASKSSTISGGNKPRNWAAQQIGLRPTVDTGETPLTVDGNTLALWSMNCGAGSVAKKADDGPAGLTLTEHNSPASATGNTTPRTDGAYAFDGSTQYLTASDTGLPSGNSPWTVEAWVKVSSFDPVPIGQNPHIFMWGGRAASYELMEISIGTNAVSGYAGTIAWGSNGENHNSTGAIAAGAWQYVAVTYDGTTVHFYINGDDAGGSFVPTHTPNLTLTGTGYVGALSASADTPVVGFMNGSLDQVKVSSVAKSATDIYNYYHGI